MFLKAFKEKSNKKYLDQLLSKRKVNVDDKKIKNLGIIINYDEIEDFKIFDALVARLKLDKKQVSVIAYTNDTRGLGNSLNKCFNSEDFGWGGIIKNEEIEDFLNREYDLLISYYTADLLYLKLLSGSSQSQIKIGVLQSDARINDIIVNTNIGAVGVFSDEVIKYLTVLNKI